MTQVLSLERFTARNHSLMENPPPPLDLDLQGGQIVSILGPSGSGKTLLLRAIADLDPGDGLALLEGRERDTYTGPEWRRLVAFVASESAWWALRVVDHFKTPPPVADLAALGLSSRLLDREVRNLSSGERQRFALLRSLANDPRVLLLDEPTAALDPTNMDYLESMVKRWVGESNGSVLWVSHDPEQVCRVADRSICITDERFLE